MIYHMFWAERCLSGADYNSLDEHLEHMSRQLFASDIQPYQVPYLPGWDQTVKQLTQTYLPFPKGPKPPASPKPILPSVTVFFAVGFFGGPVTLFPLFLSAEARVFTILGWAIFLALGYISNQSWNRYERERKANVWDKFAPYRLQVTTEITSAVQSQVQFLWDEYDRPTPTLAPHAVQRASRAPLPWDPAGPRPVPMVQCSSRDAEYLARSWMLFLGATGSEVSPATRDGGADVTSPEFVAEVKHHQSPVSPALVRQIFGVATASRKRAIFFSLSGYSVASQLFADQTGVALFEYDYAVGTLSAHSDAARKAMREGLRSLLE